MSHGPPVQLPANDHVRFTFWPFFSPRTFLARVTVPDMEKLPSSLGSPGSAADAAPATSAAAPSAPMIAWVILDSVTIV